MKPSRISTSQPPPPPPPQSAQARAQTRSDALAGRVQQSPRPASPRQTSPVPRQDQPLRARATATAIAPPAPSRVATERSQNPIYQITEADWESSSDSSSGINEAKDSDDALDDKRDLAQFYKDHKKEISKQSAKAEKNMRSIFRREKMMQHKKMEHLPVPLTHQEFDAINEYAFSPLGAHAYRDYIYGVSLTELKDAYGQSTTVEGLDRFCKELSSVLRKLPLHTPAVVFHGYLSQKENMENLAIGDFITNRGFLSASVSREFAISYAYDDEGWSPREQPTILVVNNKTGRNIAGLIKDKNYSAAEVLFQPNQVFEIKKKIYAPEKDILYIYANEVSDRKATGTEKDLLTSQPCPPSFRHVLGLGDT